MLASRRAPPQIWFDCQKPMMTYEPIARMLDPVARPSRPSATFTPFEVDTVSSTIQARNSTVPMTVRAP